MKVLFSVVQLKGEGGVEIGKLIRTTLETFKNGLVSCSRFE